MTNIRRIVVAADFSEGSRQAFQVACSLADEDETRILVLHVMEPKYEAEPPLYFGDHSVRFKRVARSPSEFVSEKECLQDAYAPHRPLDVEYRITEGGAAEEIVRACEQTGGDLVVMGTHGRTGLPRLLMGSVAEAVLRGVSCATLALRDRPSASMTTSDEVILHPTDFSECSQAALRVAHALARARGSRLILLHVVPVEMYTEIPIGPDYGPPRAEMASLASQVDASELKHPVETRLVEGDVPAEIVRVADEVGCALIVIGTHGRSGLGRMLMGSIAESVIRKSGRAVVAVKSAQKNLSHAPETAGATAKLS